MSIKTINNFFDDDFYNNLIMNINSSNLTWNINNNVVNDISNKNLFNFKNKYYNWQLVITLFNIIGAQEKNLDYNKLKEEIFNNLINNKSLINLNISQLLRIKINIKMNSCNKIFDYGFHIDHNIHNIDNEIQNNYKLKTLIIYLNTCNGYTLFKHNKQKIYSEDNKAVLFDSNLYHSGSTTTNADKRIVLNINYIEK